MESDLDRRAVGHAADLDARPPHFVKSGQRLCPLALRHRHQKTRRRLLTEGYRGKHECCPLALGTEPDPSVTRGKRRSLFFRSTACFRPPSPSACTNSNPAGEIAKILPVLNSSRFSQRQCSCYCSKLIIGVSVPFDALLEPRPGRSRARALSAADTRFIHFAAYRALQIYRKIGAELPLLLILFWLYSRKVMQESYVGHHKGWHQAHRSVTHDYK